MTRVNWWLRLTSSGWSQPARTVYERERTRRSRLTAWIILALVIICIVLIPSGLSAPSTLAAIALLLAGTLVAAGLNRAGGVTGAGVVLVMLINLAILGAVVLVPTGQLTLIYLPAYDLFAVAVIISASILPPAYSFISAGVSIALILGDFFLQPHGNDVTVAIHQYGAASLVTRPVALQIIVAAVAFLWVRGTLDATQRADRAEELAQLERQQLEQRRQLEIGVQQLLETHVRLANGDFSARANLTQDHQLWQVAASLNNLVGRLQKSGQTEYLLRRTADEAQRLNQALEAVRAGRRPIWPAPSGTPLDPLILSLSGRNPAPLPPSYQAIEQPLRGGASPWASGAQSPVFGQQPGMTTGQLPGTGPLSGYQQTPPNGPSRPNEPLPSWLQPPTNARPGGDPPYGTQPDQSLGEYGDNPWFLSPERGQ